MWGIRTRGWGEGHHGGASGAGVRGTGDKRQGMGGGCGALRLRGRVSGARGPGAGVQVSPEGRAWGAAWAAGSFAGSNSCK